MENFKGTKGSWFVVNVNDHPTHNGEQVAFIQTATHAFDVGAVEESFINRETFKANAQLIAHAPEMLEMLSKAKYELEQFRDSFGQGSLLIDEIEQLINSATSIK